MPARLADWPDRFERLLQGMERAEFDWGWADCFTWACKCANELTDPSPPRYGDPFLGQYRTRLGALRILQRYSMRDIGDIAFGHRIPPLCAQRGDIALVPAGDGQHAFAVVDHERCLGPATTGGLAVVPLSEALVAWRIG